MVGTETTGEHLALADRDKILRVIAQNAIQMFKLHGITLASDIAYYMNEAMSAEVSAVGELEVNER